MQARKDLLDNLKNAPAVAPPPQQPAAFGSAGYYDGYYGSGGVGGNGMTDNVSDFK